MKVYELSRDQMIELKQRYLMDQYEDRHLGEPSYDELATVDSDITDNEIYQVYSGIEFTNDDFFCTAGQEEEYSDTTLEDKLLALEARVRFIQDSNYIPFVSPYPSSTEKQLADYVAKAADYLNAAANCAHLLRY